MISVPDCVYIPDFITTRDYKIRTVECRNSAVWGFISFFNSVTIPMKLMVMAAKTLCFRGNLLLALPFPSCPVITQCFRGSLPLALSPFPCPVIIQCFRSNLLLALPLASCPVITQCFRGNLPFALPSLPCPVIIQCFRGSLLLALPFPYVLPYNERVDAKLSS